MLKIEVPGKEYWDEEREVIVTVDPTVLYLEHNLLSLSEWEAIYKKPFLLDKREETQEENLAYIQCMSLNGPIEDSVLKSLTEAQWQEIQEYIKSSQTATTINSVSKKSRKRIVTSEVIYSWMIMQNIPKEFETWHLGRLMTLIEVVSIESNPKKKKRSSYDVAKQYHDLNARRLAASGGSG